MPVFRLFLWAMLVGAAWLVQVYYNAWPGPWLLTCAAVLPPVLFLLSLPSMLGLKIQLEGPSRVVRGTKAEYTLRLSNKRLLPVRSVRMQIELCNQYTENVTQESYCIRNLSSARITLPLPAADCGVISCRILRCEVQDILGLFVIRRSFDTELSCAVLPEAQKARVDLDAALDAVRILKPKYGGGFSEEHDLRDYRPGDLPNSIHWKLSSKTDRLIVREALTIENCDVFVVLEQPGTNDEGLAVLRWLSAELLRREEPHIIIADGVYPIENESESEAALISLLSSPMRPPCAFDPRRARCVFRVRGSEVSAE